MVWEKYCAFCDFSDVFNWDLCYMLEYIVRELRSVGNGGKKRRNTQSVKLTKKNLVYFIHILNSFWHTNKKIGQNLKKNTV